MHLTTAHSGYLFADYAFVISWVYQKSCSKNFGFKMLEN